MTFQDVFTSSFLERVDAVPLLDMALALLLACLVGLFVVFVYRRTYSGVMYSASFGATLVALTLVTTLVILAVSSNVLLSLGMVGALSIVRFRTPVKEPLDIVFLFWCIAAGIVLAAGLIPLALLGSVFIGAVLLAFSARRNVDRPYLLVMRASTEEVARAAESLVRERARAASLKSKTVAPGCIELDFEVRLRGEDSALVDELAAREGVSDVALVSYNGDYLG
ncbi:DUF4956 domain-containing protein [Olsenella sp. An188]|uniref:DUF4956 domain-containing protein n=1 Tax=Olsenella sp. An188 TaxID=1965579 RepID=UPI000B3A4ACD|nr:DUF4956 domain-containing protein [Olsenella sp. An188]OUP37781.1 DUF4956 domain-containing protein [Olsenella sp. An188]